MRLAGKRAVVTGASSGIGAAIAAAYATEGAKVLAVGRDEAKLAALGDGVEALACDVTADGAGERIVAAAKERLGGLDVLVHSAGLYEPRLFADTDAGAYDRHMAVNVRAPFLITRAALPELRAGGTVIFLSSVLGHEGFAWSSAYCTSKGAIEMLVKSLAVELGGEGVRVNAIAPGWVQTPMNAGILANTAYRDLQVETTPLGRLGTPADIAPLAVFLASDESGFVHGASVWIDGGFPAPPQVK